MPQPIKYPRSPPKTEAIEQTVANQRERDGAPRQRAISNGSGGKGNREDSKKATVERAGTPYLVSAQLSTQLYNRLSIF